MRNGRKFEKTPTNDLIHTYNTDECPYTKGK